MRVGVRVGEEKEAIAVHMVGVGEGAIQVSNCKSTDIICDSYWTYIAVKININNCIDG